MYRAVSWPAAAASAFVAVTAFIAVYEEAYARAAAHDERDSGAPEGLDPFASAPL